MKVRRNGVGPLRKRVVRRVGVVAIGQAHRKDTGRLQGKGDGVGAELVDKAVVGARVGLVLIVGVGRGHIQAHFELGGELGIEVGAQREPLVARAAQNAILLEVGARHVEPEGLTTARRRDFVLRDGGGAENLVLPVSVGQVGGRVVIKRVVAQASVNGRLFGVSNELRVVHHLNFLRDGLRAHVAVVTKPGLAGFAPLRRNEDYAVAAPRAVDGRRCRILQNLN